MQPCSHLLHPCRRKRLAAPRVGQPTPRRFHFDMRSSSRAAQSRPHGRRQHYTIRLSNFFLFIPSLGPPVHGSSLAAPFSWPCCHRRMLFDHDVAVCRAGEPCCWSGRPEGSIGPAQLSFYSALILIHPPRTPAHTHTTLFPSLCPSSFFFFRPTARPGNEIRPAYFASGLRLLSCLTDRRQNCGCQCSVRHAKEQWRAVEASGAPPIGELCPSSLRPQGTMSG